MAWCRPRVAERRSRSLWVAAHPIDGHVRDVSRLAGTGSDQGIVAGSDPETGPLATEPAFTDPAVQSAAASREPWTPLQANRRLVARARSKHPRCGQRAAHPVLAALQPEPFAAVPDEVIQAAPGVLDMADTFYAQCREFLAQADRGRVLLADFIAESQELHALDGSSLDLLTPLPGLIGRDTFPERAAVALTCIPVAVRRTNEPTSRRPSTMQYAAGTRAVQPSSASSWPRGSGSTPHGCA